MVVLLLGSVVSLLKLRFCSSFDICVPSNSAGFQIGLAVVCAASVAAAVYAEGLRFFAVSLLMQGVAQLNPLSEKTDSILIHHHR